jgi:hypothetical protein
MDCLYIFTNFTIVHRNGVKIPHADAISRCIQGENPDNEATETLSHLTIAENTITNTAKPLHQTEIDNYIDDRLMINSVQTTHHSNTSLNTSPILQSDNTHFENKPHHLETETTPSVLENTKPTLVLPTLNDSPDNAQTLTPPCNDFPTPTLPRCQLNLSPILHNATIETTPTIETFNTTTSISSTKHPDKIINNIPFTVPLPNPRLQNINSNIKVSPMLGVQTDFTGQKPHSCPDSLSHNQIIYPADYQKVSRT